MKDVDLNARRIQREIAARKAAEALLETKSLELYEANAKLLELNSELENQVEERTMALAQSEKKYRSLIEGAHDIIFVTNQEGYITYINHVAETYFGFKKEDILGSHFSTFIKPEYQEQVVSSLQESISNQDENTYVEFPSFKKGNNWIWLGQNIQFSYSGDGYLMESVSIARDITKQKEEEEILISQELQLRSLIGNLHAGILFQSKNREILQVNSYLCEFFDLDKEPDELVGSSVEEISLRILDELEYPEQLEVIIDQAEKRVAQEIRLKDDRYIQYDFIPIFSNGILLGTLWQFVEVTALKELELEIRNSEEKYRGIIENMELGLLEVDKDGIITRAFDWFCRMTGYSEEELLGKNGQDFLLPPEYVPILEQNHEKRALGHQSVYEVELIKKNGERIWTIISGAPFYNLAGEIVGSIGIHFDITDQKNLQAEILKAKEIAEQAQEAEQQFLASMSHEIRTPLNAVIGMSHLLYDTEPTSEQREYLEVIQYSANLLNNLVTDILDFTKIKSGVIDVHESEFDLGALVNTLYKTFELKAVNKPVKISIVQPKIDTLFIGDETLINQVLYNLLGNAEKFTAEGEISLEISLQDQKDDEVEVQFIVRDTGIGISSSKQESIFDEFRQESRETKTKYGGTGLGLSITKKIVEFLGGQIDVQSKKGKGTTFSVLIPLRRTSKKVSERRSTGLTISSDLPLLVVEDNLMNQNYIGKLLKKEKLDFDIANNGLEALDLAKTKKYSLIFMDISMPVMDGYETTIKLRKNDSPNTDTPIVALTASALSTKKNKAFELGMNSYMTKPFTPSELKKTLSQYLGTTEEHQEEHSAKFSKGDTILDRDTIRMFYNDNDEAALEMFEMFLIQYDTLNESLYSSLRNKEYSEAQKIAHRIKPTFTMVGAPELQTAFQKLEDALRYEDESGIQSYWQGIEKLLLDYIPAIKEEYEELKQRV